MNENDLKNLINIPKELDNVVLVALEKGRKDKLKANKKKNIIKRSSIAAAIILCSTVALGTLNPNMVSALPGINRVVETFNASLFGEPITKYQDVAKVINKRVTSNGTTITLNEAAFDDSVLMLALTVEGEFLKGYTDLNENDFFDIIPEITLNNEKLNGVSTRIKILNDTTGAIILTSNVAELSLGDSADIKLVLNNLSRGHDTAKGKWKFKFNLEKQTDGKKISLNPSIGSSDFKINEVNLITSSLSSTLIFKGYSKNIADPRLHPNLLVTDNNGNFFIAKFNSGCCRPEGDFDTTYEIKGDLSNSEYIEIVPKNFKSSVTIDNNGYTYSLLKTTGSNNGVYEKTVVSRPPSKDELNAGFGANSVTYHLNIDKQKEFKTLNELINSEIKVSSTETVTIKNIESTDRYTRIFFESKGLYDYENFSETVLFDEEMNDTSRSEGGLRTAIEDSKAKLFSITLGPVDTSKKYKIAIPMMPEVDINNPEWVINIPLH